MDKLREAMLKYVNRGWGVSQALDELGIDADTWAEMCQDNSFFNKMKKRFPKLQAPVAKEKELSAETKEYNALVQKVLEYKLDEVIEMIDNDLPLDALKAIIADHEKQMLDALKEEAVALKLAFHPQTGYKKLLEKVKEAKQQEAKDGGEGNQQGRGQEGN